MISFQLTEHSEKLRADFRHWLSSHNPPLLSHQSPLEEFVEKSRNWVQALAASRFLGVHWPEEFGGRGLTIVEEAVLQEELARAGSPLPINLFGLTMVGPVLIEHGTEEQKKRFLPNILNAEEIWCQGFSEPGAGSDLAAVRTAAQREESETGESWSVSGQKVWTSFAQFADWCFLLARTEEKAEKHKGLSYFLVPMAVEGVDVRPLKQISGDEEFNEIFFDGARIPEKNIVGAPGDGWKMAISTLMYERVVLTFIRHMQSEQMLNHVKEFLHEKGGSPEESQRLGKLAARNMAMRTLALSHLSQYGEGVSPGPEGSLDKLGWSENFQEICQFAMDILGESSILTSGECAFKEGFFPFQYLYSRGRSIAAGTSEIQKTIIAERVLGLPRAPR